MAGIWIWTLIKFEYEFNQVFDPISSSESTSSWQNRSKWIWHVQNSVDCLIYIVPTGNLENMLSDGIVTYDKTVKILEEFAKVISVPVWVIGININY